MYTYSVLLMSETTVKFAWLNKMVSIRFKVIKCTCHILPDFVALVGFGVSHN